MYCNESLKSSDVVASGHLEICLKGWGEKKGMLNPLQHLGCRNAIDSSYLRFFLGVIMDTIDNSF